MPQRFASGDGKTVGLPDLEFTFAPYWDLPQLGFGRSREFCMTTLRHPSFEGTELATRRAFYEQKRSDRKDRAARIFRQCDTNQSNQLDEAQLRVALSRIGLPPNLATIAGIQQRHGRAADGTIGVENFLDVVTEAWGRVPDAQFSDEFAIVHARLEGLRAFSFIGRNSPANWVLRAVRNLWPYALKRVAILRNIADNPNYDPELMEVILDLYEGGGLPGVNSAMQFAELAAKQAPLAKGGFVIRIVPNLDTEMRWEPGGEITYVPFVGLPENPGPGLLTTVGAWIKALRE